MLLVEKKYKKVTHHTFMNLTALSKIHTVEQIDLDHVKDGLLVDF